MKWAYSISQKQTAALLLAVIFVVVGLINILDRNTIDKLETSFSAVYEDRLLAESYIYRLSDHLYQKKLIIETTEDTAGIWKQLELHNLSINAIIIDYEQTKLTPAESVFFTDFKKCVNSIASIEERSMKGVGASLAESTSVQFDAAFKNLQYLSDIQVSEGRWLNENSKRIIAGSDTLTQLELAMLICIGLMVQVLIFASRSIVSRLPGKPSMN